MNLINVFFVACQYAVSLGFSIYLIPKVAKATGIVEFGQVGIWLSIFSYVAVAVNYSFIISGQPRVAVTDEREQLGELLINVIAGKLILSAILIIACTIIFWILSVLSIGVDARTIVVIALASTVTTINTAWFLQARQRFKSVSQINIVASLLSVALGVIVINKLESIDANVGFLIVILPQLITGAATLAVALRSYVRNANADIHNCIFYFRAEIKNGFGLFASQAISSLYLISGPLVLGLTSTPYETGVLTLLDRVTSAIVVAMLSFFAVSSPRLAILFHSNNAKYKKLVFQLVGIHLLLSTCVFQAVVLNVEALSGHFFETVNERLSVAIITSASIIFLGIFGPLVTNHYVLSGKHNYVLFLTALIFVVTIGLGLFLSRTEGAMGWLVGVFMGQILTLVAFSYLFMTREK